MPPDIKTEKRIGKLCILRPVRSYVCLLHVHFMFVFFLDENLKILSILAFTVP